MWRERKKKKKSGGEEAEEEWKGDEEGEGWGGFRSVGACLSVWLYPPERVTVMWKGGEEEEEEEGHFSSCGV